MKQRIWELDAARGICILGMLVVHFLYDIAGIFPTLGITQNPVFDFCTEWGGVVFFLISGICVILGSRPVRRGLTVLAAGLLVSAVTVAMVRLALSDKSIIIYFGVLHCLGVCMLLWPLVRKLPVWALGILAVVLIVLGQILDGYTFTWGTFLFPLGFQPAGFASSDYFPLLPFWGFFLLGSLLGKLLYKQKVSLFPRVDPQTPLIRFFAWVGRWSLPVYLLHQPIFSGIVFLLEVLI